MRAGNRLLAVLVGVALMAAGLLAIIEVVLAALGQPFVLVPGTSWLRVLRTTSWSDRTPMIVLGITTAVGAVLVGVELRRWPPRRVAVSLDEDPEQWWITRRSLERHLARRVQRTVAADRATCRIRRARRHWRLRVALKAAPSITADDARAPIRARLDELHVPGDANIRVRISAARRVA